LTTTSTTKFSIQLFPVALITTAVFFILKLVNILHFDWIWVFSPILILLAVLVILMIIMAVTFGFVAFLAVLVAVKTK
jgi:hypothetical protein